MYDMLLYKKQNRIGKKTTSHHGSDSQVPNTGLDCWVTPESLRQVPSI